MVLVTLAARAEWKPVPGRIMTEWAGKVDPSNPLPEYPRPQLVRENWINLNGLWDFAVVKKNDSQPAQFEGKILVPFCIESALSGVKRKFLPEQRLWYSRFFTPPALTAGERLLIHFGAVDYEANVLVNNKPVGFHKGGYDAFTFDITDAIKTGENRLVVSILDATGGTQVTGKQRLDAFDKPSGFFYTPTSGIWQTVWLEKVPANYVAGLKISPDIDAGTVTVTVNARSGTAKVDVLDGGRTVASAEGVAGQPVVLKIPDAKLWSPESPFLYNLTVSLGADSVKSYFGMRKISIGKDDKGILRPMLNNKYVHMHGPLDQGFWPDGIYTAPTDEALKYDIEMTRKLGFNMTRKHIKVEPARWYYWTDKLGLLVWQDMPSGDIGHGAGPDKNTREIKDGAPVTPEAASQHELELKTMVEQHYNAPSIIWWIVFNEGWGQYDTVRLTNLVKNLDPTRIVTNASGWNDIPAGDVIDNHGYPGPARPTPTAGRIAVNGEFGGIGFVVPGHLWVPQQEKSSMYSTAQDKADYEGRFLALWKKVHADDKDPGVSAAVYTQITDVELEVNGLMTYDRKVVKVDPSAVAAVVRGEFSPGERRSGN